MKVFLGKGTYKGSVDVIGSKSFAHRYLIASFLSKNTSTISNAPSSKDIEATLNCIKALGGTYKVDGDKITILGKAPIEGAPKLNCIESGSTLRFFIPVALALTDKVTFTGSERLIDRGIGVYERMLAKQHIEVIKHKKSLTFNGRLKSGVFEIEGSISSQFITGLLFALPLLDGDSIIKIIPPIYSRNYIDITLCILKMYGIKYKIEGNSIKVPGKQKYVAKDHEVEGDYSNAAFFAALNYLDSDVKVKKLNPDSLQGDKAYIDLFEKLTEEDAEIDISNCIDLGPVLFVLAAMLNGGTFTGTSRLAIKESNRAEAIRDELSMLNVEMEIKKNSVYIAPKSLRYRDNMSFSAHNDHRIAMALSLLSTRMDVVIDEAESVNKSYPGYFEILKKLGGQIRYE